MIALLIIVFIILSWGLLKEDSYCSHLNSIFEEDDDPT
jgi:hypothetical protein